MGYLLVTLLIGNETGIHAAIFYIGRIRCHNTIIR
jgi:formate hydrogenlyase subunit 3/multisubunit Na+/H+ antiporter MnhD subunit